jgi:hypothetical protein
MTKWDAFISHASEDKEVVARPLASALTHAGLRIWLDAQEIGVGDSIRQKIDEGLRLSHFGVVVLSPAFMKKRWPSNELNALFATQTRILPVWHNVRQPRVAQYSPLLADLAAVSTSVGMPEVSAAILGAIDRASKNKTGPQSVAARLWTLLGRDPSSDQLRAFFSRYPLLLGASSSDLVKISVDVGGVIADFFVGRLFPSAGSICWRPVIFDRVDVPPGEWRMSRSRVRDCREIAAWARHENARPHQRGLRPDQTGRFGVTLEEGATIYCGRRGVLTSDDKRALEKASAYLRRFRAEVRTYDTLLDRAAAFGNHPARS